MFILFIAIFYSILESQTCFFIPLKTTISTQHLPIKPLRLLLTAIHSDRLDDGNLSINDNDVIGKDLEVDNAVYDLFLQQLSEEFQGNDNEIEDNPHLNDIMSRNLLPSKEIITSPTKLVVNDVVEFIYKNKLMIGNYLGHRKNSITIQTTSGSILTIDIGQVISVWDNLADESPLPCTPISWSSITMNVLEILRKVSPRKSDLEEFWKLVSQRSIEIPVDSLDLSIYIFQESKFRMWIDPYSEASDAKVRAMSIAERYAAAVLLYNDRTHFKRKPTSVYIKNKEDGEPTTMYSIDDDEEEDDKDEEDGLYLYLIEGGYRVLDESIAMFKECESFSRYYHHTVTPQKEAEEGLLSSISSSSSNVARLLRIIELYSLANISKKNKEAKLVNMILKKLELPITQAGARTLLFNLGVSTTATPGYRAPRINNQINSAGTSSSQEESATATSRDYVYNLTPWSTDVLLAAQELKQEAEQRTRTLNTMDPTVKSGKKSASGRMDYRTSISEHPVICIDNKYASFYDDAFSLSPDTGELLVHISDVMSLLRRYEPLQQVAKERVSSAFLPSGPLHMLPPQALESLKLSSTDPNEVLTVALSVDYYTGEILAYRVFPSLIGPVFPIDTNTANEIIAGIYVDNIVDTTTTTTATTTVSEMYDEEIVVTREGDDNKQLNSIDIPNKLWYVGKDRWNLKRMQSLDDEDDDELKEAPVITKQQKQQQPESVLQPQNSKQQKKRILDRIRTRSIRYMNESGESQILSSRAGYSNELLRDLRTTYYLVDKICQYNSNHKNKKSLIHFNPMNVFDNDIDDISSSSSSSSNSNSASHRLLNTLLTLYSTSAYALCMAKNINVPIAWENRDKTDKTKIRRFATQPLRNWISQLQQKQLRAALKMELPLSKSDCALAVSHHNRKRQLSANVLGASMAATKRDKSFESFQSYYHYITSTSNIINDIDHHNIVTTSITKRIHSSNSNKSINNGDTTTTIAVNNKEEVINKMVTFMAEGVGKGGLVRIKPYNIIGIANNNVKQGETVQVQVISVNSNTKQVKLLLV